MKLKRIELQNFRGIDRVELELQDQINLFVGINGAGKSSILDAIAISLSWVVNRIQRENASGKPILLTSIKNRKEFAAITTTFQEANDDFIWKIVKVHTGTGVNEKSDLSAVSALSGYYVQKRRDTNSLPVFAYYPINRVVGNVTVDVNAKDSISIIDVYDNALGGQTNYQAFFEWFRLQDDIVNEGVSSRSKWMRNHKPWIKKRINKLVGYFDKLILEPDEDQEFFKKRLQERFKMDEIIYDDPRYLFHELTDMFRFVIYRQRDNKAYMRIYEELDFMLHRMSQLSESRRDNLIEVNEYPARIVFQVLDHIKRLRKSVSSWDSELKLISFVWDTLLFSVLLSLWWMSEKGKKGIESLFSQFSPVKQHQILSNEKTDTFMRELENLIRDDVERFNNATRNQGRELHFVTQTIERFVEGYSDLRVKRAPRPHLLVDKGGEPFNIDQLSDGEKNLIAMVGDIARRLSMANPQARNPLDGEGIILIDEIDLHLHPSWQRLMIPKLSELFPGCQFIISTHSPQVISHTHPSSIFLLKSENNKIHIQKALESYGMNTDRILEDILNVPSRPAEQQEMIRSIYKQITSGEIEQAANAIEKLLIMIGNDPELTKAQTLIKRKAIIGK